MLDTKIKQYQLFELDDGTVFSSKDTYWRDIPWGRVVKITMVLKMREFVFEIGSGDGFLTFRSEKREPEYINVSDLHNHFKWMLFVDDVLGRDKKPTGQYVVFSQLSIGGDEELEFKGNSDEVDEFIKAFKSGKHVQRGATRLYLRKIVTQGWIVGIIKAGMVHLTEINFKTGETMLDATIPLNDPDLADHVQKAGYNHLLKGAA